MYDVLLKDGVDLVTPRPAVQPGSLQDCYNYEVGTRVGYQRMDGFERFDGHMSPSNRDIWRLTIPTSAIFQKPFVVGDRLYTGDRTQNLVRFSRDLTAPGWVEWSIGKAAKDEVGIEGVANTASTLTDDSGVFAGYFYYSKTITDRDKFLFRAFIKKDSDETRFPLVGLEITGKGTAFYHLNTKTGSSVAITSGTPLPNKAIKVNGYGLWWEVLVYGEPTESGEWVGRLYPSDGTVFGTQSAAATGSIIIGNAEMHVNASIASIEGNDPVYTDYGSAVDSFTKDQEFGVVVATATPNS